ncbi:Hypothetical protein CINCED_3A013843 [Cinara cedri]|uniref:Uncharacterized protein n=1 Tax=Cinara cedri TaxID=506608 RepID=A0A5E4N7R1_9HEMI|nr:Hypothetical protein CINCED_3A013843 [Cinara cedri]
METTLFLITFGVLCCCCLPSGNAFPEKEPPLQQRKLQVSGIDPSSLDVLPDTGADNNREKRQLSSVQSKLLNFLKPLPIVDVTKEEEKYGNDGDKFNRFGRSFIDGVETVSSVVTSALSFPLDTVKKLSRKANEALNNVGGRIVGLQR